MSRGSEARFDALLDGCRRLLGRIGARVESRLGDLTGPVEWGDVNDAAGLLRSLWGSARVARVPDLPEDWTVLADGGSLPVLASDACPACGSAEVGTAQSVPGVALGRISDGCVEWSGQTEMDWNGAETLRTPDGVVLACASCGGRWVHPSLATP